MSSPKSAMDVERLEQIDRQNVWHGFTQMAEYEPLIIERAEQNWLIDIRGRRFLDGVSSLWCNVHGHSCHKITEAIKQQLDAVAHVTSLGMSNVPAVELAARLAELAPAELNHVFYSSDGSSAVEAALKMAFQYWRQRDDPRPEKTRFAALGSAYHGDTTGGVSLGGVSRFHSLFGPLLFDVVRLPTPDCYRAPAEVAPENLCAYYLDQCEAILTREADALAGVVVEPLVQGAAGMIVHPPGFLAGLRDLTRRLDILLICDEVATGFGRTGRMFACEHESVAPDLMCAGKGLTGGYLPMAVTMASDEIWEAFLGPASAAKQFFHGHTYGGNPLAAAAALASLDQMQQDRTLEQVARKQRVLAEHLARLEAHPCVGDVRQCGLMVGVELVECKKTKQSFPAEQLRGRRVCEHALERGVWLRPLGDVVVMMPPLSIREDEIELMVSAVAEALEQEFATKQSGAVERCDAAARIES